MVKKKDEKEIKTGKIGNEAELKTGDAAKTQPKTAKIAEIGEGIKSGREIRSADDKEIEDDNVKFSDENLKTYR